MKLKKHSPEILVAGGIVGAVASTVMACKATLKIDEVLAPSVEQEHKIKGRAADKDGKFADQYTEKDYKRDLTLLYGQRGLALVKLYSPALALGTLSITAILAGHNITRKRNVALAAAYATVDKGFKEYRGRVIDRFGKEIDRELKYNIQKKTVEETVTDEKTGKVKTVKKDIEVADLSEHSDYARFFDQSCDGWTKDPEYNLMFLKDQQRYANNLLESKGSVFLNEVYDILGMPRTTAGQLVGWIYDKDHPNGDNMIDFGIYDTYNTATRRFVNGYEPVILLDFNVDGEIYNKI